MRFGKKEKAKSDSDMDLTPMIDIIFQLLTFFLLSARFIAFEGQLQAHLPKDRGLDAAPAQIELANLTLFLEWDKAAERVSCKTIQYDPPGGGGRLPVYEFAADSRAARGEQGNIEVRTTMGVGSRTGTVIYDYVVPDFQEIEAYMQHRKETHEAQGTGKTLPVTVNFGDGVPWQMVVTILDMCDRQGITDFTINAQESQY
jgi:biopolymer transport protein ExbD